MKEIYVRMREMTEDILGDSTILLDYIKNSDDSEVIKIRPIVKLIFKYSDDLCLEMLRLTSSADELKNFE